MQYIVKPLERARKDGIILTSGDGATRQCFPILAAYVGDYYEQILVGLIIKGECPICPAPCDKIGNRESVMVLEPRNTDKVIAALNFIDKGASEFTKACASAGIKPVQCIF
jgi:Plavaka transposase